jgi:hypothetical protein
MMHVYRSAFLACKDHRMGMALAARTQLSVAVDRGSY